MTRHLPTDGLMAVAVTPLDADGAVDIPSVGTLTEFYLRSGVTGITLLGVMGEANRLTTEEARLVVRETLQAASGRASVLVGVSDSSLERLAALARDAMAAGADGVLVQPLANQTSPEAVAGYFQTVGRVLGPEIPICVQDFPKASNTYISLPCWRLIVETSPSVVMLKHEEEPGLAKLSAIRRAEQEGLRRVTILAGNNGIHLPQELLRGADGAMTGFAFPDILAEVCRLIGEGHDDEAEDLFDASLPINRHELRLGIAVRKELLRRRGAIAHATCRYPVSSLDAIAHAELDRLLRRFLTRPPARWSQIDAAPVAHV